MASDVSAASRPASLLGDTAMILRYHIVLIAIAAALVFGFLLAGRYLWLVAVFTAVDWLLINLLNRVTDIEEDLANAIPGTARVARHRRAFVIGCWGLLAGSFAISIWLLPALTSLRVVVQLIGFGYNYRLIPTPSGWRRFKEIYFLKNFMSSVLFVLTCFLYPLAATGWQPSGGWLVVGLLIAFFVPFELTYEILYDLRDLDGDRKEGIPTYPVVHGADGARRIIDALLALSLVPLVVGVVLGAFGVRELLFAAAPPLQLALYRPRFRRGLTTPDCVWLTHFGTALLAFFLLGTAVWLRLGLPANIYLVHR